MTLLEDLYEVFNGVWPEGLAIIAQEAPRGRIVGRTAGKPHQIQRDFDGSWWSKASAVVGDDEYRAGKWNSPRIDGSLVFRPLADDHKTAVLTPEMWENHRTSGLFYELKDHI